MARLAVRNRNRENNGVEAMTLSSSQVWYITQVYPESVTADEVQSQYEEAVTTDSDKAYWEAAARLLNQFCQEKESQDSVEAVFSETDADIHWEAKDQLSLMAGYLNQYCDVQHFRGIVMEKVMAHKQAIA